MHGESHESLDASEEFNPLEDSGAENPLLSFASTLVHASRAEATPRIAARTIPSFSPAALSPAAVSPSSQSHSQSYSQGSPGSGVSDRRLRFVGMLLATGDGSHSPDGSRDMRDKRSPGPPTPMRWAPAPTLSAKGPDSGLGRHDPAHAAHAAAAEIQAEDEANQSRRFNFISESHNPENTVQLISATASIAASNAASTTASSTASNAKTSATSSSKGFRLPWEPLPMESSTSVSVPTEASTGPPTPPPTPDAFPEPEAKTGAKVEANGATDSGRPDPHLPGYTCHGLLGTGAFSEVWAAAEAGGLKGWVAVKVADKVRPATRILILASNFTPNPHHVPYEITNFHALSPYLVNSNPCPEP